ncbi:MAG: ATP-binding cassette domain-containing protein [Methyloprofundus sp.]|nr:ATP-binding cassette domain-containing protein [Methyloprofundus sp.]
MLNSHENKFLFDICRPYRIQIIVFFLLSSITSLLDGISIGLLVPLLGAIQQVDSYDKLPRAMQWLASMFSGFTMEQKLLYSISAIVISVLLKNLFLSLSFWVGLWTGSKVTANARSKINTTLLDVNIDYFHKSETGKIIDSVLNHTASLHILFEVVTKFVVNFLTLFGLFILLMLFSWQLTLVTFFFVTMIVMIMFQYTKRVKRLAKKRSVNQQDYSGILHEMVSGIVVIKSFAQEKSQQAKAQQKIDACQQSSYQTQLANSLVLIITEALAVLIIGILFALAVMSDVESSLLPLQILPFFYILIRMVPHLKRINHDRSSIISHWPSLEIVADLIRRDNKPFLIDGSTPFQSLQQGIRLESVSFAYAPEHPEILKQLNLTIPSGKTTALVGESGAGKSTLINLLLRFYDPVAGTIWVDSVQLTDLKLDSYRRKIGVVSQDTFIFNDTVKNNIAFGGLSTLDDAAVINAAKKANADDFIRQLPDGYETILGDRGVKLSGGQRQRIAIARAVLENPDILILDEATSALDNHSERQVHQALADLRKNRTVIIIAHRLSTIKEADQIVVLKEGSIVEQGDEVHLLALKGVYYDLATGNGITL